MKILSFLKNTGMTRWFFLFVLFLVFSFDISQTITGVIGINGIWSYFQSLTAQFYEKADGENMGTYILRAPFTNQAPFFNFLEKPWDEFCEEGAMLMLVKYYEKDVVEVIPENEIEIMFSNPKSIKVIYENEVISRSDTASLLLETKEYEEKILGYYKNTGIEDMIKILRGFYGLSVRAESIENPSQIKKKIISGKPVITLASPKILSYRDLKREGIVFRVFSRPVYLHALLIIGFDDSDKTFIVHDDGRIYGMYYKYPQDFLFKNLGDWDQKKGLIDKKVMITVE